MADLVLKLSFVAVKLLEQLVLVWNLPLKDLTLSLLSLFNALFKLSLIKINLFKTCLVLFIKLLGDLISYFADLLIDTWLSRTLLGWWYTFFIDWMLLIVIWLLPSWVLCKMVHFSIVWTAILEKDYFVISTWGNIITIYLWLCYGFLKFISNKMVVFEVVWLLIEGGVSARALITACHLFQINIKLKVFIRKSLNIPHCYL